MFHTVGDLMPFGIVEPPEIAHKIARYPPYALKRHIAPLLEDESGMPTYSEDYVKTTESGLAYLKYLRDKKFERNIPVKISLVSLFLSALSTAAVVVRLLFDYFGKK